MSGLSEGKANWLWVLGLPIVFWNEAFLHLSSHPFRNISETKLLAQSWGYGGDKANPVPAFLELS